MPGSRVKPSVIPLDALRDLIALAVATANAYDVPKVCVQLGIQQATGPDDGQDALVASGSMLVAASSRGTSQHFLTLQRECFANISPRTSQRPLSTENVYRLVDKLWASTIND